MQQEIPRKMNENPQFPDFLPAAHLQYTKALAMRTSS